MESFGELDGQMAVFKKTTLIKRYDTATSRVWVLYLSRREMQLRQARTVAAGAVIMCTGSLMQLLPCGEACGTPCAFSFYPLTSCIIH